jgi:predicted transcriptional regulator
MTPCPAGLIFSVEILLRPKTSESLATLRSLREYSTAFYAILGSVSGTSRDQISSAGQGVIQQKWGEALGAGFQVVPNVMIQDQNRLGLDTIDIVILLNLMSHWWERDARPFVSPATIAKRMRVTTRTVERHLKKLENRKIIGREPRGPRNTDGPYFRSYDLIPLAEVLKEASQNALKERARRAKERRSSL